MKLTYNSTIIKNEQLFENQGEKVFSPDDGVENNAINIFPDFEDQTFEGGGGAFTESTGYVYSKLSQEEKDRFISKYFDTDKMNYQLGRLHLDSCDFSLSEYEAMSDPDDRKMTSFSMDRVQKNILPLLKDVKEKTGKNLDLMISPWSPPAFMKTNGKREKGKLKNEYQGFWADYICKYIQELKGLGVEVHCLTIQNEPNAEQIWDSCFYTAQEEKVFLKDYLYPALKKNHLSDEIEIFIWDHNKERVYERACAMIDEETDSMISGIAFHWYSGDHFEALDLIHKRFPNKKLVLSEMCIEYNKYDSEDPLKNAQIYAHDIIGNLNAGMNAFYDWNLLLNKDGGPNHVNNLCEAPFMYDEEKNKLLAKNSLQYLNHFTHYIQPGAIRIGYSKYTDTLEITAFKNPNGTIIMVILNKYDEEKEVNIRLNSMVSNIAIKPLSITSVVIDRNL
ncbi:glycoside hydrolase family 30 protein [Dellaglioa sp. BT-FLS60]